MKVALWNVSYKMCDRTSFAVKKEWNMLKFKTKLALFGLFMLGVLAGGISIEIAKIITPDEDIQNTIGVIVGIIAAVSPVLGLIVWNQLKHHRKCLVISNFVEADEDSCRRVRQKVSTMIRRLDYVRNYERHVWGIGDFTPFIRVRRYIKPTTELVNYINQLERDLVGHPGFLTSAF